MALPTPPLRPYYFHDTEGNFGDDLNTWLLPKLLPGVLDIDHPAHVGSNDNSDHPLFVGIGTILDYRIPATPQKVVFSTGTGYNAPPEIDDTWTFLAVRGPLTAERLGLDASTAMTDGGALLRTLNFDVPDKTYPVSYVPHCYSTEITDWEAICDRAGIHYIHPRWSVEKVIDEIQRSEVVISEAMHGAILSDTLRVPWIPVRFHGHINRFKWTDWCASLGLAYEPEEMSFHLGSASTHWQKAREYVKSTLAVRFLKGVLQKDPMLSETATLDARVEDLDRALTPLRDGVLHP